MQLSLGSVRRGGVILRKVESKVKSPRISRGRFVPVREHADVAIVVVTFNSSRDLPRLLEDLRAATEDLSIRVIAVDNRSSDSTVELLRSHTDIVVVDAGGNLGYAGGINAGLPFTDQCDSILILNPDLSLAPGAVARMHATLGPESDVGAVVPLILDEDDAVYPSIRREPSMAGALGDALFGSHMRLRPKFLSETVHRAAEYRTPHDVDWATGAAVLLRAALVRELGAWNERFFLYSEETDYLRRVRESGRSVRFEPSAVVRHRQGGSGTSPALAALMAVNRVRYAELHHGPAYAALFRTVVALAELLRSYDPPHRRTLAIVLDRRRWSGLPQAQRPAPVPVLQGPLRRGAVIVPAFNEAALIEQSITPLSSAAVEGYIELIVVCNGCTDDTPEIARGIPGVTVVELEEGSKSAALNAGDRTATLWPRLYLDADIEIQVSAVLAVLDRLSTGDVLAARPNFRYDSDCAGRLVRSYYRARRRIPQHRQSLWGAGAYGLSAEGHERIGEFPSRTGDDLFVDTQFDASEKVVVPTQPVVVRTPTDVGSLLAILRRSHRGWLEARVTDNRTPSTRAATVSAVLRSIHGPRSTVDAVVYLGLALVARRSTRRKPVRWERDESSRQRR
ncbi:glycosyltransferase family 2 protein [Rhodococcus zopfii]|uniref:glycosyltransferase family 2 protein n=1 Tax=Rhodococcus zopfii TaxID=43772 RepID=UPI0014872EC1|nr:glycosyltransferase family 2 protein [Rhodococcus zopfii]